MGIKISGLTEVEAWSPSAGGAIPVGEHVAVIDDAEEGKSSGGHPQVTLTWSVCEGPHQGCNSREWLVIVPAAYGKLRSFLDAVNWPISPEFEMPVSQLKGRKAQIVVREEEYNGSTRVKIVGHNRVSSLQGADPDVPIDTAGLEPVSVTSDIPF